MAVSTRNIDDRVWILFQVKWKWVKAILLVSIVWDNYFKCELKCNKKYYWTYLKNTHRHRKQTCGYQRGKKGGINKKQGPTVQHRVLYIQ